MNKSAIADHMVKYINEVSDLMAVLITDEEGVHIFSSFDSTTEVKREKLIRMTTMIISTINQSEGNFEKLGKKKSANPITFYYHEYLIHFHKNSLYYVVLCMNPKASGLLATDLAA